MFYNKSMAKIISLLLDPVTLFMASAIAGLLVCAFKRKAGLYIILLAGCQLWLFSLPSVAALMASYMERNVYQYSANPDAYYLDNRSIDVIVIMGGHNKQSNHTSKMDNLGIASTKRVIEGLAIANQIKTTRIIVSGQEGHAEHVQQTLTAGGIAAERIIVNSPVRNTQAEIESIADILVNDDRVSRGSSIMIISSASHIPRIKIWARHYGLFPLYSGVAYQGAVPNNSQNIGSALLMLVPSSYAATTSHAIMHEVAGIIYAKAFILRKRLDF